MNKNLRYRLALEMFGSNKLLKAIAMSLLVRHRTNTNIVKDFTINKLAQITGMHATTIKKRLHTLKEYGLVSYCGKNLVFRTLVSRHKKRNIRLAKIAYGKVKDIERSLQAILVAVIQLRKEFAKRTIRNAHHGFVAKDIKAAQKTARRYKWGNEYAEHGLGYEKIAKTLSVCKATATKIVNYAIGRSILKKQTHYEYTFMPGVNYRFVDGFTFTTKNYGFIVRANTYEVAPCLCTFRGGLIRG